MTSDPDQIRDQITRTQQNLSADVDALGEKVSPPRIAQRRVQRTRDAMTNMKETIMGSASSASDRAGSQAAATLLARDPAAHAALDNPADVARLLDSLRRAGADEQAVALVDRLPAAGLFGLFLEREGLVDQFRFGREADGTPAAPWD